VDDTPEPKRYEHESDVYIYISQMSVVAPAYGRDLNSHNYTIIQYTEQGKPVELS